MLSCIWKELQLFTACSKIARTSVKVRKTELLPLVLHQVQESRNIEFHFAEMTYTPCKCCLSIFTKIQQQRQLSWYFLSLFYFWSIISAFLTSKMSFIEVFVGLRICLFRNVITVLSEFSKTCYLSTVSTLLLLTMTSMQSCLLQTNSSFPLRLSESQGMFNLGKVCQTSEAKIWKPAYRHQPVHCSLIKHAVSANQSARDLETLL